MKTAKDWDDGPAVTIHTEGQRKSAKALKLSGFVLFWGSVGACTTGSAFLGVPMFILSSVVYGAGVFVKWWHHG